VVVLNDVTPPVNSHECLTSRDLALLEELIVKCHIELVILDPSTVTGKRHTWRESEVRSVLMPCGHRRAPRRRHHRRDHLTKDNAKAAIHRAQGSVPSAVARAMLRSLPTEVPELRYFVSVKQNYAQHPRP